MEEKSKNVDSTTEEEKSGNVDSDRQIETEYNEAESAEVSSLKGNITEENKEIWRDLLSYWILGFCNSFGIFVILTAALDIVDHFSEILEETSKADQEEDKRPCRLVSTAVILLADSLPELLVKAILPFSPFWITARISIKIVTSFCGFILVSIADRPYAIILGVILVSGSSGLGETSLLQYCSQFNRKAVSAWSSGMGAAGLTGALIYTGIKVLNTDYRLGLLGLLIVPLIESVVFFLLLRPPRVEIVNQINKSDLAIAQLKRQPRKKSVHFDDEVVLVSFCAKLKYSIELSDYILPLIFGCFSQYLMTNGLFELIYFEDIFLKHEAQYRWLNVIFQFGNFVSRSSVPFYEVNKLWILAIIQLLNLIYILWEIIFYITPNIWYIFVLVFWEGLLSGAVYVNTFYKMLKKVPPTRQEFAIGLVAIAVPFSIITADLSAILIHKVICLTDKPTR